ncbi:MAG: helix-turn-helix domain-containing protein [Mollicutes bacterium]|nr:helix-turn-helix domain-containing protein [Mollicutes bacterium]MCI7084327.1 helix-turn-helix domain-containing protein [Mycoplasmatota bacterium]
MIVDTFTNRLNQAMHEQGLRQIDLVKKTKLVMEKYIKNYKGNGIDKSLLNKYIKGVAIAKQDKIYILAKALNVSEGWLMGYDVDKDRDWIEDEDYSTLMIDNGRYIETEIKTIKIPVLGKVPAGTPIEAIQDVIGYENIPATMLNSGENYFALKIDGNSMSPDYKNGDIIIVKQQEDCNSGDDCVVMVNGDDATFKRVIKQNNAIILKPLNNEYEPYYFTSKEIITKPVKIIGVAIEIRRKLK